MAGYFLYSLDGDAFTQLVTAPTDAQARALAEPLLAENRGELARVGWPTDLDELTAFVKARLAAADWYGDLSDEQAELWDAVVWSFRSEPGAACGLGFECTDYESIYWDCAEFCEEHGAPALGEPAFGNRGFRCPPSEPGLGGYDRMYRLYLPAEVAALHEQLRAVEPHAAALSDRDPEDDEDESLGGQFFLGLYGPVADARARGRALFVQTDT
ncbi:hypothetical protein [Alienimonas californiensis]|uniref:Uncharacterized protein n=1 Tax=Alienimonas californiensis TaxID=2527989 RepID=A0A517P599_9PLAN|nr:hypothetical protein [Alienimonas californiensis]QDT14541.1 hypothetical protein CA12_06160 [Alienimonas californiensis]